MITRHLEPEHNVRPFLGGIFHAVPGEPPAFSEEGMSGAGEEAIGRKEKKRTMEEHIVQSEDNVLSKNDVSSKDDVRKDAGKVVKKEGEELKNEKTVVEGHEKKKMVGEERPDVKWAVKGEERQAPGAERVMKGEERLALGIDKKPDGDDMEVKGVPLIQGKTQAEVEMRLKYLTRETPVLLDTGENERVGQREPVEGRGGNVFQTNVSPAAPERQQVHVSIGRIEIKAVMPPAETKISPVKKEAAVMGLDQYLEQRNPAKQ